MKEQFFLSDIKQLKLKRKTDKNIQKVAMSLNL